MPRPVTGIGEFRSDHAPVSVALTARQRPGTARRARGGGGEGRVKTKQGKRGWQPACREEYSLLLNETFKRLRPASLQQASEMIATVAEQCKQQEEVVDATLMLPVCALASCARCTPPAGTSGIM